MASDNEEIYLGQYDLNARRVIESLTLPRYWDFDQFKGVLVALAKAGNGASIPAPNRPESIHVQSWRQHINKLKQLTGETGREHARAVFADTESGSLVFGKTTRERNVSKSCRKCTCTSWTRNCSRVKWARLSYFLSDKREQAMLMAFGEEYLMIVLKTSATPNNIDKK